MKPLIVGNWKCNPPSMKEAVLLFDSVKKEAKKHKKIEVVLCPPFPFISIFRAKNAGVFLGGQDCFPEQKGAFTGEVSAFMLESIGVKYVIVGHSERRKIFGETNEIINRKIKAALSANLQPILCVGETQEERNAGRTTEVLETQAEKGLEGISRKNIKNIIFAYEPVWAIGTGKVCPPEEAQTMGLFLRKVISKLLDSNISEDVRILYGGSVNSENAVLFLAEAGLQGLLIGGASLDHQEFGRILKKIEKSL